MLHRCSPHRRGSEYAPWLGVGSMDGQPNIGTAACPPTEESVLAEARQAFEELVCFCLGKNGRFGNSRNGCWYSCSAWAVC